MQGVRCTPLSPKMGVQLNGEGQQEENKIEKWEEEDWMKEEPEEEDWSKDQEEESVIGIERLYRVCYGKARARYVRVGKETGVLEGAWRGKWNRKQENPSPALDWIEGDQEENHWIEEMVGRDEEYWIKEVEEEKEEVWIGEKEEQETGGESLATESKGTAGLKIYAVDECTGKGITCCKESDKAHSRIRNTDEPVWRVNELLSSLVINERKYINRSFTQSMNQGLQVIKTIQEPYYKRARVLKSLPLQITLPIDMMTQKKMSVEKRQRCRRYLTLIF
ncbi:uncharacterized protein LOC111716272 [Eurytemora carolleeae]|uniref:uncharacterized protein LOC111716272 n=1 Tax=Eurytemora carolleeae TaxID=1294199 RepID=UPI000C75F69A|nr:uncharacterized protein LOC111716272 [Eurytemora carolleeae]|eukprot:XP_023347479.1 uncharacterized protein LOC111716272 [Eurytemora affinis]